MTYRPLPDSLTIQESSINGLGLFAKHFIPAGVNLGVTHIADSRFEDGYIRSPLGGFFNHSEDPNCEIREGSLVNSLCLITIKEVPAQQELTATYTLYVPE